MTLQGSNLSLMMYGAELSEEAVKVCYRIRLSMPLQKRLNAMVSVRLLQFPDISMIQTGIRHQFINHLKSVDKNRKGVG